MYLRYVLFFFTQIILRDFIIKNKHNTFLSNMYAHLYFFIKKNFLDN